MLLKRLYRNNNEDLLNRVFLNDFSQIWKAPGGNDIRFIERGREKEIDRVASRANSKLHCRQSGKAIYAVLQATPVGPSPASAITRDSKTSATSRGST